MLVIERRETHRKSRRSCMTWITTTSLSRPTEKKTADSACIKNCNMDQQPNSLKDNGLYCFLSVCLYLPVTNHRSKSMGVAVRCPHRHPSIHGGPARDLCYGVLSHSVSCSNTLLNIRHCLSIRCIRWIRNISFYDGRYYWNLDAGLPKYSRLDQAVMNEYRRNDVCRSSRQCSGSTYSCFFRCFRIFVSFKNFYHSQED